MKYAVLFFTQGPESQSESPCTSHDLIRLFKGHKPLRRLQLGESLDPGIQSGTGRWILRHSRAILSPPSLIGSRTLRRGLSFLRLIRASGVFEIMKKLLILVAVFILCLTALGCAAGNAWYYPYGPPYFGEGLPTEYGRLTPSDFISLPRPRSSPR